jgi:biotin operon repressor
MNLALSTDDRIDMLREENRQLRDRIARLEGGNMQMVAVKRLGLTALQARIFCLLVQRGEASHEVLIDASYDVHWQAMMGDTMSGLRTAVKHMRKRIRPLGIDVQTIYALGYAMSDQNRARARQIMEGAAC